MEDNKDIDKKLKKVVQKLLYIANYNNIKRASDLKKYIYTNNFKEEEFKLFKEVFTFYGEMNIYTCVIFYKKGNIDTRGKLIKKIKGLI
jgi:hypothetical protein